MNSGPITPRPPSIAHAVMILLPVAMHALWDFSTFTSKAHPPSPVFSYASFALLLTILTLNLVAVIWCLGKKCQPVYP